MRGARILIAEDNGLAAEGLRVMLAEMGYTVSAVVASGEEVLPAVIQHSPDLVLMDIRLEGKLDGVEAAQQLDGSEVPVVYLTAYSDDATLSRAKVSAPFGYLVKPVQDVELHAAIEVALHRHRADRQAREYARRLHETRRQVLQEVLAIQEEQDRRVRHNLHDQIAQVLAAVCLCAERGKQTRTLTEAHALHQQTADTCRNMVQDIRRLVADLRPSLLDHLGLPAALEALADEVLRRHGIRAELRIPANAKQELSAEVQTGLYRIAEEAFSNVVRHASAGQVSLTLHLAAEGIRLEIRDDGVGFNAEMPLQEPRNRAIGLALMRERAEWLGGTLHLETRQANGTCIRATIPPTGMPSSAR